MYHRSRLFTLTLFFILGTLQASGQDAVSEIMASFSKLDALKGYRIRTAVTPSGQFAQQMEMAKQMGLDMVMKPMIQEVVNPNLRKITMDVPVMSMPSLPSMANMQDMKNMPKNVPPIGSMQMKSYRMKMYGVSNGTAMATYLDCPECQQSIDDAMRQQMRQYMKELTMSLLRSLEGGPTSLLGHAITSAIVPVMEQAIAKKMIEKEEGEASLNRWTCRDVKKDPSAPTSPPNLLNAKATGRTMVGADEAKTYSFSILDEQSQKEMPMTLYVSAASGLPLRIEMTQPEGSMSVEYYDFDAPITIDVPECMKK
jgi:outer membrane lipoprotein-sorting protein